MSLLDSIISQANLEFVRKDTEVLKLALKKCELLEEDIYVVSENVSSINKVEFMYYLFTEKEFNEYKIEKEVSYRLVEYKNLELYKKVRTSF